MKEKNKITKWLYWFIFAISIIIVYKMLDNFVAIGLFFKNLLGILMPFIMGMLIAYILYIPCKKIESWFYKCKIKFIRKRRRGLAIFSVYLILILLIIILMNCILPPVITSVKDLINNLPGYYDTLTKIINDLPEDSIFVKLNVKELLNNIAAIDFNKYIAPEYITQYLKGAMSFATGIFDIFVTIVISIYTLAERGRIVEFIKKLLSGGVWLSEISYISKIFYKDESSIF